MIPAEHAWNEHQDTVDETVFTPWADKGWLSHNGQSPEVAVCDFVRTLVRMMQPNAVIETGVGQGYMTRTIASALEKVGKLVAFESDDDWRHMIAAQEFWFERKTVATLSPHHTPSAEAMALADLCVFDSDFDVRVDEIVLWDLWAKPGSVALVHDTMDREETSHKLVSELIQDLGMTGVFLNNPRGCFLAVQPKEKVMAVQYTDDSAGPSTRRSSGETWAEGNGGGTAATSSSEMTKAALQALAEERGLATSGTKQDLLDRLSGVGS